MTAIFTQMMSKNINGTRNIWAFIESSSPVSSPPTTGANIAGMSARDRFAPFSVLYVTQKDAKPKMYIANESGTFIAQ